ncbi:uncharacterized protein LOC125187348 [Salvia hispanica]|uniref:uncharacterized protein LOC125187348 n=1 Tax=Salvia hispanica TaxID=49212 RepID=UPI0020093A17|nr:uncharacterized protein LOC125187348 [Salvia hispanica]
MDLSLPDLLDDVTSFASKTGYHTLDDLMSDFSPFHGCDMLEEDALNEKSCMQVLKIWIDKADEDIVKLEEDILMLQCQLAWDDEKWSKQCTVALREKTDHLDILIQRLKKDNNGNNLQSETEELPPRLHDLLKPLMESYIAKSEQAETSMPQMPVPPDAEHNKKTEENASTIMLKTYERKGKSTELEDRKIYLPQQKKDAVIRNFDASADKCTNDEVAVKVVNKPSTLERRRMLNSLHTQLELPDPMVKELSASMSVEKATSREVEEKKNNYDKASSEAKVIRGKIRHKIKADYMKARTEPLSKAGKARVSYERSTRSTSVKTVKTKGRNTKILQIQEAVKDLATEMKNPSLNDRTKQVNSARMESEECQIQVQQKASKEWQQIVQNPQPVVHEVHVMVAKKDRVSKKETEQHVSKNDVAGPSEGTAASSLFPQEPLSSQTTSQKGGLKISLMKHAKTKCDASNSTAEEATDGPKNVPHYLPSSCIKTTEKLSLSNLKAIAKSRKIRSPCSLNDRTKQVNSDRMESEECQIQVQQKESKEWQQILQNPQPVVHEVHVMVPKKDGVSKKETEQQLSKNDVAGPSEGTAASNLLSQEPLSSQISLMKHAKTKCDASNSMAEEATDGAKNVPHNPPASCIKTMEKLSLSNLRAIAKSRKIRGYSRLKKEELRKFLGFD